MSSARSSEDSDATSESLLYSLKTSPESFVWDNFVNKYQPLITKWCRSWGLQDADCHDAAQEVLLRLCKALKQFDYDPSKSFRAWLKTVTRRCVSTQNKRLLRAGRGEGGSEVLERLNSVEAQDDLVKRIDDDYSQELANLALLRVRTKVHPRTWDAFRLTTQEGMAGKEVAQKLNMQVAHVYVAKSEVLKALRNEVQRLEPSDDEPHVGNR
ncbi:MAG: sigma-70 family RNA polymerase sigma factor [Planctomycetota bacterium]